MLKTKLFIALVSASFWQVLAQDTPAVITPSYPLVQGFNVAPGQLLTMVVHLGFPHGIRTTVRAAGGSDLPLSLAGMRGGYGQGLPNHPPTPFLEVHPYWGGCPTVARGSCTNLAAVTVQIPFEAMWQPQRPGEGVPAGIISLFLGEQHGPLVYVGTVRDQVHVLTTCDAFLIPDAFSHPRDPTGLPCPSVVAHADGSLVTAENPARPGEEVIAYAVGLGQTDPPLQTGKLVTAPARTQVTFGLDFNYRPNALGSKPLPDAPAPIYSGATPGYVGLYQINFQIPPPPPGTPPCVAVRDRRENLVYSNLTVSVGGTASFDAARLCVAVNP